jgi:hypothetical protein
MGYEQTVDNLCAERSKKQIMKCPQKSLWVTSPRITRWEHEDKGYARKWKCPKHENQSELQRTYSYSPIYSNIVSSRGRQGSLVRKGRSAWSNAEDGENGNTSVLRDAVVDAYSGCCCQAPPNEAHYTHAPLLPGSISPVRHSTWARHHTLWPF